MDKELAILEEMANDSGISQRSLAKHTGISLGSINLLINKMIREGLIKIERADINTIRYMLTPEGIMEKSKKTYKYIKNNFAYINNTKSKMKEAVKEILEKEKNLVILEEKDGPYELLRVAVSELGSFSRITYIDSYDKITDNTQAVITMSCEMQERFRNSGINAYNIMEQI